MPRPPADAKTLIVFLGVMPRLWQIPAHMAAVMLLEAQVFVVNRLVGVLYPHWAPESTPSAAQL